MFAISLKVRNPEVLGCILDPGSDVLRRNEIPEADELKRLLTSCGILGTMEPAATRLLVDAIRHDEKFRNADLPDIVTRGTAIRDLWIHARRLGNSATRMLEAKRLRIAARGRTEGPEAQS